MNRLFWGIALLVLAAAGGWAQSTWRGQAEVWAAATAPAEGFVVASNEFPRNSLLTVENYKTKKTIQVRVVAPLPAGSSALVLLNPKSARALEIKAGEAPMVGVQIDPTGVDRPDNPDPDVNPLAAKTPGVAAPVAAPGAAAAPGLPLPALADRTPLPVADEPDTTAPVTPGKKVFLTSRDPEPEAPAPTPVPTPVAPAAEPVAEAAAPPATPTEPATPAPVVPTPVAVAPVAAPVVEAPVVAPVPVAALPVTPAPASSWVSVPGKLEGSVLGQVPVLAGLEKGRSYVQVGAWSTQADLMKAMETVKTYVPLALYQASGEKNPWRMVVASAPRSQLGVLLMLFKSQGFRAASVVKG